MTAPTRHDARQQQRDDYSAEAAYGSPPADDASAQEKANYALARWQIQNDHYAGLYQQWVKPIYFLVGKQWLQWNERQYAFSLNTDIPSWKQQPTTNFTYAVYRTLLAKCTKQRPTVEVVPPSGDSEDREAAKLGEAIVEFLWRELKSPQKVVRAIGWLLATGNVAFNVDWDADAGQCRPRSVLVEVQHPEDPQQTVDVDCACDEEGEPHRLTPAFDGDVALDGGAPYDLERAPEMVPVGEITLTIEDPLSYRFNPEATSEDDAEEFLHGCFWPRAAAATYFDVDPEDLATGASDAGEERDTLDEMLASVTAGAPDPFNAKWTSTASRAHELREDRVFVLHYYRKPSEVEGFPEGRHWIVAGGRLVYPKPDADADDRAWAKSGVEPGALEAPLPHGFWPPRVHVVDCPIPGQPQGLGVLSQIVPLNEKYNFNDGKIGEFHTMMAMGGKYYVHPDDKNIRITTEPGQVVASKGYVHNKPPIREKLEGLPAEVYGEREVIKANIQLVAGVSQLDLGQRPEGVTAGRAFLVIQEASDAAITPTITALENAIAEIARRELVLVQRYYDEPRTIKIRGEKGQWEFRSFQGADLRDGLDVRVQAGSMFPWSKSAQWDIKLSVLDSAAGQAFMMGDDGKPDRSMFSKLLEPSGMGLQSFGMDEDPDLSEINREHAMFEEYDPEDPAKSNQIPQLAVWQNQVKHQLEHYNFMKRSFARFERWSDAAKIAFIEHMRLTTEAVAELVQAAMGAAPGGASGGAPGAPAEPTEPAAPGPAGPSNAAPSGPRSQIRLTKGDRASAQSA